MKKLLLALVPAVAVLLLCALFFGDNCLNAFTIKLALGLSAAVVGISELRRMKMEQIASGLNEDEYLLKQAGGRIQLLSQSATEKAIGWFFIVISVLSAFASLWLFAKSPAPAVVVFVIGILCFAVGVSGLRSAKKSHRAAARSPSKPNDAA